MAQHDGVGLHTSIVSAAEEVSLIDMHGAMDSSFPFTSIAQIVWNRKDQIPSAIRVRVQKNKTEQSTKE
jgi:ribosomal protein L31E